MEEGEAEARGLFARLIFFNAQVISHFHHRLWLELPPNKDLNMEGVILSLVIFSYDQLSTFWYKKGL